MFSAFGISNDCWRYRYCSFLGSDFQALNIEADGWIGL